MTISTRHFWVFVAALLAANIATLLVTAAVMRAAPGLREHTPGF